MPNDIAAVDCRHQFPVFTGIRGNGTSVAAREVLQREPALTGR